MATIRITKLFDFEMAHALTDYRGACKNIHGHSYKLAVTITGTPHNTPTAHDDGMLIDFHTFSAVIKDCIINVFDHALVVNKRGFPDTKNIPPFAKTIRLPYQPTCENLITEFADRIQKKLPGHVNLFSLRLYETKTAYAEWYAEDQK